MRWFLLVTAASIACTKPAPSTTIAPSGGSGAGSGAPVTKHAWDRPGADRAGACCVADTECGGLPCLPYEYGLPDCRSVCTLVCEPGELCPAAAGTGGGPTPCAASRVCPVGRPGT